MFLDENEIEEQIESEANKLYEQHIKTAIKVGIIQKTEMDNLNKLKVDLLISDDVAKDIYERNANEIVKKYIDEFINNERYSPEDENQIQKIASNLGVNLSINAETAYSLKKYRLYWQLENAEIPEIQSDITIQKSEKLYFSTFIKWLEQRRVTKRYNYGGPTARIKLAKGVYYRLGSLGVQRTTEDVWQTIDTGQMYLSNKRLIFMGTKGSKTIQINKIFDIKPYRNGVDIQKDSGKSPFLEFEDNVDIFSMILYRLMHE